MDGVHIEGEEPLVQDPEADTEKPWIEVHPFRTQTEALGNMPGMKTKQSHEMKKIIIMRAALMRRLIQIRKPCEEFVSGIARANRQVVYDNQREICRAAEIDLMLAG